MGRIGGCGEKKKMGRGTVPCPTSGLMAQDENGVWWYFYWGPIDESFRFELFTGVPAGGFCVQINVDHELASVEDVQNAINSTKFDKDRYNRSDKITGIVYFSGDYSKTVETAKKLSKGSTYYLATYNCVQLTFAAFFSSDDRFGMLPYGDYRDSIPNAVYNRVLMLPRDKNKRPLPFLW